MVISVPEESSLVTLLCCRGGGETQLGAIQPEQDFGYPTFRLKNVYFA